MVDCAAGQPISCGSDGKSGPPAGCKNEIAAVQSCFGGTSGGGATCSADASGNCGCTGAGGVIGMNCQGATCTCLKSGTATGVAFPSAGVCQNPGKAMDAACK